MNKEEFDKRLNELCNTRIKPISKTELLEAISMLNEKVSIEDIESAIPIIKNGVNTTHNCKILNIKYTPLKCPDCSKEVTNRRVEYQWRNQKKYWRKKCLKCGNCSDPQTNQMTLESNNASRIYYWYENKSDK
jgi:hypothetical protein